MKTKKPNRYFHWACSLTILVSPVELNAQTVNVDVNLNVGHSFTGNATYMDRKKFINIHADVNDHDWEETDYEFTNNFRNDFLNRYDVNMGRATGGIGWTMNNVIREDPNRKGFADVSHIQSEGIRSKNNYAAKTDWHRYEGRNQQVLAAQLHPLYPDGTKTQKGWSFSQTDNSNQPFGTASGQFFAHYIKNFHGNGGGSGPLAPSYVEIVNEPLWELSDEIDKVFKFHRTVSQEIKKINPNVQVGGYCTAFPDFEVDNFDRWKNRWQKFMDSSGQFMDFWAIHLYDFPSIGRGQKRLRRGSNIEATFDMLEQYSMMKFGRIKPTIISEYGAQSHDYRGAWSPYRDYLHNTSCNAMTMQFMQRANTIGAAINFTMIKGEWATTGVNDTMGNRLVRRKNEPNSLSGPWVYADSVHFYQLWSDVKGRRVDSRPSNIDIMTDAYVTGNKAYVLLNNLDWSNKQVNINLFGRNGANIQSLKVKNYRRNNNNTAGVIYQSTHNAGSIPGSITMGAEGTAILEYTFSKNIPVNQTSNERKYYATSYLKPIRANQTLNFDINSVGTGSDQGEVMLRIGMGRAHGKSLNPTVSVNGYLVDVPTNWRGDAQADRSSFFGVLEVPVPYEFLKWNNRISLTFGDNGGHVSSVAMQVFGFSSNVRRSFLNTNAQKTFKQIAVAATERRGASGQTTKFTIGAAKRGSSLPVPLPNFRLVSRGTSWA